MSARRVVITGLGSVCPLGLDVPTIWKNLKEGKSGITNITDFNTTDFPTKFAGLVPNFVADKYMPAKDTKKTDLFIQYGIAAANQAIEDSGLDKDSADFDKDRFGVFMGSGIGGLETIEKAKENLIATANPKKISPFFIPSAIVNMISGHVSIKYDFRGPNLSMATACTTGTHAIGLAYRLIVCGDADVMVAGGAEKASTQLGMGGFAAARALSRRNDEPQKASRPWDINRDGFVLGDGSGALVLEEYEHAKKRGAKIYAEVCGFGMSGDAFHITRPSGDGAVLAMKNAIRDAAIDPSEINYINAHGTSTPAGDVEESNAIKLALGDSNAKNAMVSSTKSMIGHLLGAAGAVEALVTVKSLETGIITPTINLDEQDPKADLDYVPHVAREAKVKYAMSNSFGFGGTNGALIFKSFN